MPERPSTNEVLQRQEKMLAKIQGQFERLDVELDSLEASMCSAGWLAKEPIDGESSVPRKPR